MQQATKPIVKGFFDIATNTISYVVSDPITKKCAISFRDSTINVAFFDKLFTDEEFFTTRKLDVKALHVPGHTPADVAYIIGDAVFAGDTIFMPDYGTARCDFPGGSAKTLYHSVQKLFSLPDETRLFMCHNYLPEVRTEYVFETTIGKEKRENIHLKTTFTQEEFIVTKNLAS